MRGPHDRTSVDDDVLTLALRRLVESEPPHDLRRRVERAIGATGSGASALWWKGMAWAAGALMLLVLAAGVLREGSVEQRAVSSHTTSPVVQSPPIGPAVAPESTTSSAEQPVPPRARHRGGDSRSSSGSTSPRVERAAITAFVPAGWRPTGLLAEGPEPIEESPGIEVASLRMPPLEVDSLAVAPLGEIEPLP